MDAALLFAVEEELVEDADSGDTKNEVGRAVEDEQIEQHQEDNSNNVEVH